MCECFGCVLIKVIRLVLLKKKYSHSTAYIAVEIICALINDKIHIFYANINEEKNIIKANILLIMKIKNK